MAARESEEGSMKKNKNIKLTILYPKEEHVYLKLACKKQGIGISKFITNAVLKSIDEYEDELWLAKIEKATKEFPG